MEKHEIIEEIERLKKEKNAVILAHNYQIPEIQDIADFTGDSLELARKATHVDADIIIFCGVKFMAETAAILNPDKKVLLPVPDAGCPMADSFTVEDLIKVKKRYPDAKVISYVNTNADVKALSDCCCTSSNAVKIVEHYKDYPVIFCPDKNLGSYVQRILDKELILVEDSCYVHDRNLLKKLKELKEEHPNAIVMVHPEMPPSIQKEADAVLSTGQMLKFAKKTMNKKFIVGTEEGILHPLRKQNPDKEFILLSPELLCKDMKKISLEHILFALQKGVFEVTVPSDVAEKAKLAIENMLNIS